MKLRRGRKKKDVNFNPSKEYLENAKEDFIKNGGRITKIEHYEFVEFIKPYYSTLAIGMEALPEVFI